VDLAGASIGQLLIPVTDLDRAIAYYRDCLGIPLLFTAPPQMSFFQAGSLRLLVGVAPPSHAGLRGSTIHFQVSDIQAVHATLAGRGVLFNVEPHIVHRTPSSELWLAEFEDPDGNHLALMSETPVQGG
jgi:predicted enzyme related to lactoylglutathione lyase